MAQALYRKWRPQTFDQVVDQEHVTQTLRNALVTGRVGHAYLFAGLRGTGKTTMARLLAKAVNCLAEDSKKRPCNECAVCRATSEGRLLDLIEIDAASHTSVDDVRELRDKVGFRPNECRYKVYIIDEVHRFSGSAFDALLKIIEEPPEYAIFILATTEIHKVPATILSRCQRFDFRRIPLRKIVQHLQSLAESEGWDFELEALTVIARSATGSMRDAISLLDQLAAAGATEITLAQVQATLGTIDAQLIEGLVDSLVARDVASGLAFINQALDQGADLRQFVRQLVDYLREMLLIKFQGASLLDGNAESLEGLTAQAEQIGVSFLVQAVKRFNQVETELKGGWQPQLPLELALVEIVTGQGGVSLSGPTAVRAPMSASKPPTVNESPENYCVRPEFVPQDVEVDRSVSTQSELSDSAFESVQEDVAGDLVLSVVHQHWPRVLEEMRARDKSVQALLNSARPSDVQGDRVTFYIAHEFARSKLEQGRAKQLVTEVLGQILGQSCRIEYKIVPSVGGEPVNTALSGEASSSSSGRAGSQDAWADDPVVQAAKKMGAQVRSIGEGRNA